MRNICVRLLLKMCSCNWEKLKFIRSFNFLLKNRFFQHQYQKQVKMRLFLLHDWFPMKFVFTYNISLVWWEIKFKRRSKVQENNMSCERALNFDQWKIFSKNLSLIMACLQIYRELSNLPTFLGVHSNSKEVSYLSWQNTYPNLKTTCHIKLKFFLWT